MSVSKQIGWGTEENLIYNLIKQTSRLNSLFPGNQPGFKVPISRQIGWSNKENLLYEWLRETTKMVAHAGNCCVPIDENFLLQENTDFILLENGGEIVLE